MERNAGGEGGKNRRTGNWAKNEKKGGPQEGLLHVNGKKEEVKKRTSPRRACEWCLRAEKADRAINDDEEEERPINPNDHPSFLLYPPIF